MTFTVIGDGKPYTIDIETIDDLWEFAARKNWQENNFSFNFRDMTISICW